MIKSLIYVNTAVPFTTLSPAPTVSNCVTAVKYTVDNHNLLLVSAYAPPRQAHKLKDLNTLLQNHRTSATSHVIVGMDSNLHHPLWNPPSYRHTHREADELIEVMTENGLSLRSKKGTPNFYPPSLTHANTTIDHTWMSPECLEMTTTCKTDVKHQYLHTSDHAAITTSVRLPLTLPSRAKFYRDWKHIDSQAFQRSLTIHLSGGMLSL